MKGGVSYVPDTLPNKDKSKKKETMQRNQNKETKTTKKMERNEEHNYGT
jgi:hypothetical protein